MKRSLTHSQLEVIKNKLIVLEAEALLEDTNELIDTIYKLVAKMYGETDHDTLLELADYYGIDIDALLETQE